MLENEPQLIVSDADVVVLVEAVLKKAAGSSNSTIRYILMIEYRHHGCHLMQILGIDSSDKCNHLFLTSSAEVSQSVHTHSPCMTLPREFAITTAMKLTARLPNQIQKLKAMVETHSW